MGMVGSGRTKARGWEAAPDGKSFNFLFGIQIRAERSIFTPLKAGPAYLPARGWVFREERIPQTGTSPGWVRWEMLKLPKRGD